MIVVLLKSLVLQLYVKFQFGFLLDLPEKKFNKKVNWESWISSLELHNWDQDLLLRNRIVPCELNSIKNRIFKGGKQNHFDKICIHAEQ